MPHRKKPFRPVPVCEEPTLQSQGSHVGFLLHRNQFTRILQLLPGCHLASGVIIWLLFFPAHQTPPYCFHSNAITEITAFSCCYHSSLSSVHIWRLSSSQERCSLQQIANCSAGSGCLWLSHGARVRTAEYREPAFTEERTPDAVFRSFRLMLICLSVIPEPDRLELEVLHFRSSPGTRLGHICIYSSDPGRVHGDLSCSGWKC